MVTFSVIKYAHYHHRVIQSCAENVIDRKKQTWRTIKCQEMSLKLNDASNVFALKMFLVDI